MESTFTVCRLLAYVIQAGGSVTTPSLQETTIFQINHARILEPKGNENVFNNGGARLFPSVQVTDTSGAVVLKMREETALELSGQPSAKEFADLASKGALNFPILCTFSLHAFSLSFLFLFKCISTTFFILFSLPTSTQKKIHFKNYLKT